MISKIALKLSSISSNIAFVNQLKLIMKKRARTSVTNPFHDGHVFDYQPFNEARHPIPLELQQYGPTLIPQWNFLEMLDYRYIHILFLVLLYSYDCTFIFHEVAAIAGEIIKNHADKEKNHQTLCRDQLPHQTRKEPRCEQTIPSFTVSCSFKTFDTSYQQKNSSYPLSWTFGT